MRLVMDLGTHSLKAAWNPIHLNPANWHWEFACLELNLSPPFTLQQWLASLQDALEALLPRLPHALNEVHCLVPAALFDISSNFNAKPLNRQLNDVTTVLRNCGLTPDFLGCSLLAEIQSLLQRPQPATGLYVALGHAEVVVCKIQDQSAILLNRESHLGCLQFCNALESLPLLPDPMNLWDAEHRLIYDWLLQIEHLFPNSAAKHPIWIGEGGSAAPNLIFWMQRLWGQPIARLSDVHIQELNPAWIPPLQGIYDGLFSHILGWET